MFCLKFDIETLEVVAVIDAKLCYYGCEMQDRPTDKQLQQAIDIGRMVAKASAECRARYGRRRTPQRTERLTQHRQRCADAAVPLRSYIGMVAWHDLPLEFDLPMRDVIGELRYERRQITKML
jgi:hypothetical protein